MWRRIVTMMMAFILLTSLHTSASDDAKGLTKSDIIESIAPYIENGEDVTITRGDCVATIMKLVGVDEDTAQGYANTMFYQPVFYDIEYSDLNFGYIVVAKYSDVAVGVSLDARGIGDFEPYRAVTNRECLAFMLRCLQDAKTVEWENIILNAVQVGLLTPDEAQSINADEALAGSTLNTLLERMLDMNRYLYWPTENPPPAYGKSMQTDTTNSIRYIDWIVEKNSIN